MKGKISKNIEGALSKVKEKGSKMKLSASFKNFISSNKFIIMIIIKKIKLTFKKL